MTALLFNIVLTLEMAFIYFRSIFFSLKVISYRLTTMLYPFSVNFYDVLDLDF